MPPMSTKLLEGERALITGCGGGIGHGIARALMQRVLADAVAEGATRALLEVRRSNGPATITWRCCKPLHHWRTI